MVAKFDRVMTGRDLDAAKEKVAPQDWRGPAVDASVPARIHQVVQDKYAARICGNVDDDSVVAIARD